MNRFSILQPGRGALVPLARGEQREWMLACIAALALRGPVIVLDGGMLFDAYRVVAAAQGRSRLLDRIRFARAFTCYQMVALLERTPAEEACTVVLDLLATFQDENVPAWERLRLLKICLPHLTRLSRSCGALVSVGLPEKMPPEAQPLFHLLEAESAQVVECRRPGLPEISVMLF